MTRPLRPLRRRARAAFAVVPALLLTLFPQSPAGADGHGRPVPVTPLVSTDLAGFVDPMIGTLGAGFVFPGPQAPFGMMQLSPDTEGQFAYTGYQYGDAFIRGFSHVHIQGMGVPMGGELPFMPVAGPVVTTDVMRYQAPFTHAAEHAEAGYYSVTMANGVTAELTAGERVGMHRYTFPPAAKGHVLLDVGRHIPGGPTESVHTTPGRIPAEVEQVDATTVVGSANSGVTHGREYPVHFAARFDRPIEAFGVWKERGDPVQWGTGSVQGTGSGAAVRFSAREDRDVVIKVGISFVDQAGALANLDAELPGSDFDFEGLRTRTVAAWNDALGAIRISGGLPNERVAFYTALYHVLQHPNLFSDADGRYLGYDHQIHRVGAPGDPMPAGSEHYANFSFWDTYRGQVQLLMLVAPDRFRDMVSSLDAIRAQGGRMPRWGLMNRYADFMNGEPALQVFADAYCRGLVPDTALETLYQDAIGLALDPSRHRDPAYLQYGYLPYDVSGTGASATLEHALGDFGLALVADRLGKTADRDALLARARSWENQVNPETGWMQPRAKDGSWKTPYRPELPDGWREGTGWQYNWLVPHDVAGLYDAIRAAQKPSTVENRLDTFFSTALNATVPLVPAEVQQKLTLFGIAYYGNQYAPSNEHDLHAPYLYDWTASPWKTQALARAYQGLYRVTPDGLPGNDDLGTMSAWYVWAALGFYPSIAGAPVYTIGSPVFPEARIAVPGGTRFTVSAPGVSVPSKYIQSATLDGAPFDRTWFTHDAIHAGGNLTLRMGPAPNTGWATGPGAAPPSQSTNSLSAFGCTP